MWIFLNGIALTLLFLVVALGLFKTLSRRRRAVPATNNSSLSPNFKINKRDLKKRYRTHWAMLREQWAQT